MENKEYKKIKEKIQKYLNDKQLCNCFLDGTISLTISILLTTLYLPLGIVAILFTGLRLIIKYEIPDKSTNDIEKSLKDLENITSHSFKTVDIKNQYYSSERNLFKKMSAILAEYYDDKISKFKLEEKIIEDLKK